jgi:ankyrin repeat protein
MFHLDQGSEIAWEYKRQILDNLTSISKHCKVQDEAAAASFQASICYIEGFGTSPNPDSALSHLQEAINLKHPIAILFGRSLRQALKGEIEGNACCTENIIRGFKSDRVEIKGLEVYNFSKAVPSKVERFKDYEAFQSWLKNLDPSERQETLCSYVIAMPYLIRMDTLSLAITMGDVDSVKTLAGMPIQDKTTQSDDTLLIQACRRGNADIVHALLDAGADPETTTKNGCSLYHWLFMLGDGARSVAKRLLASRSKCSRSLLLDRPCSEHYTLHPQWPLKLTGTPLAFAILCGSSVAVEALLDLGALPYTPIYGLFGDPSKAKWTPMHIAVKFHLADILRLLLARMVESSPFTSQDQSVSVSPFELACSISHSTIIERLAMHGKGHIESLMETLALLPLQALHSVSSDGLTPLMEAIDFSNLDTVRAMLKVSPELAFKRFVDPEDKRSFTYPAIFAAQIAARRDSSLALNIVQLLLKQNADYFMVRDSEGRTALHLSVTGYSISLTKWLLENGYEVNAPDNNGRTAIYSARSSASLDILLGAGADINHTDRSGFTSVHLAALQGFEDVVESLITRKASLTIIKGFIGAPLHCAVLKQFFRIIYMLLNAQDKYGNAGVNVNAVDGNGDTALHLAVHASRADIIQLLLSHGANPNIRNVRGFTPVHQCVLSGDVTMLRTFLFAEKSFRETRKLHDSNFQCPCEESKKHISRQFECTPHAIGFWPLIDFDVSDERGRSPLHTAASYAGTEMALNLIEHRANPYLQDADGNATAHLAVAATDESIAGKGGNRLEFLKMFPKCLTAKNRKGHLPWDISRGRNDFSLLHFILSKHGPRACNYETLLSRSTGRKLLHEAIDRDEWDFVSLLFDPINRSKLSHQEIKVRISAQQARGKTDHKPVINEADFERVFTTLLTCQRRGSEEDLTNLTNPKEARDSDQIAQEVLFQIGKYNEKQRGNLCRVISNALDYRILGELKQAFDAPGGGSFDYLNTLRLLHTFYADQLLELMRLALLDPFRFKRAQHNVLALEAEALVQLEMSLRHAPLGKPLKTYTRLLRLFQEANFQELIRLANTVSLLWTDRILEESRDSSADCLRGHPVSDALQLKDGAALKQLFPIDRPESV